MKRWPPALLIVASILFSPNLGADEPSANLDGTWFQRIRTTSLTKLPVIGKVSNESNFYAVVKLEQSDGSLRMKTTPCFVQMEGEVKRVKTIVPDAMTRAMGPRVRTGSRSGDRVQFGKAIDVLGAKLSNEWKDPLPDEPDEPSVFDEDGDGKPGVTVRISGPVDGEIFVVQRAWNALDGRVDDDGDRIEGHVTWASEQKVLDSTSMFLKSNPPSEPASDKAKNTFTMHRVKPEASCADLRRRYVSIFQER